MLQFTIDRETISKYDVVGPRYTSYPTAPEWTKDVTAGVYTEKLKAFGRTSKTASLYIHIPFCQSMCYFCACNVVIRKKEDKYGDEYLNFLFKEIELVRKSLGGKKKIRQLHWGGGTPTFLSETQIERLFQKINENFEIDNDGEIAIEIDPRAIDKNKVKKLREIGFNRVSMGIQDFNPEVQEVVNRRQPFFMVKDLFDWCRELKFLSINCDLIYGLPHQTTTAFRDTVEKVIQLRPDRIALYSFAYVPWLKKHQSKLEKETLPSNDEKLDIFLQSREQFLGGGYQAIAMDHFALKNDEMAKAYNTGTLYRNFMGYTVKPADEYIGMGITAIGFLENTFIQNHKTLKDYYGELSEGRLPVERGKVLSLDDITRQWVIRSLMCQFQIDKTEFRKTFDIRFDDYFIEERNHIDKCLRDQLIMEEGEVILATDLGKIFIRNICMGFDWYLRQQNAHRRFSRTV